MRLIGNKTKLLPAIEEFLRARGVEGGTLLDVFAGSGSVGQHFRKAGFRVLANDLMRSSFLRQQVYVELAAYPPLEGVRALTRVRRYLASAPGREALRALPPGPPAAAPLREVIAYLDGLPGKAGLFARQYAEGGPAGRLFFSAANGARIDAIHGELMTWRRGKRLAPGELELLLCALLEAADRVANISGTYGAFLKQLQTSAREPLVLRPPAVETGAPAGRAYCEDANHLASRVACDVLYLDPPYNHRQYVKNYHVLEVLAELHTVRDVRAYEAGIYGKTGLRRFEDRLSAYCRSARRRGQTSPCEHAFRDLVARASAEHIVVSYNEEGILDRDAIGAALADAAGLRRFDFRRDFREVRHKRFRSDKAHTAKRRYRVLEGRDRDEVVEWLFYVRKPASRRGRVGRTG